MDPTDAMVMGLTSYKIALVFHIAGALALFGAIGMEILTVALLRSAKSVERVRLVSRIMKRLPAIFLAASGVVLVSGLYLGYLNWHYHERVGWIIVSLVAFVLTGIYGSMVSRSLKARLMDKLAASGRRFTPDVLQLARQRRPVVDAGISTGSLLGILVVMIFQPSALACIVIIVNAVIYGFIFCFIPLANSGT